MGRLRRSFTLVLLVLAVLLVALVWLHSRTTAYDDRIAQAAARNRLDFDLIKALIYEESWFRPDIRGGAGELGLMQVSMAAARDFAAGTGFPPPTEERVLEAALNIEIGS